MSISNKLLGGLCFVTVGLAAVNIVQTLADSPAFVESARVDGVFGDWRLKTGPALYDRSEYLFQLGYGYLSADSKFSAATEGRGEIAGGETGIERAKLASELITQSLELSPGNAHAWAVLAGAQLTTQDYDEALGSLRRSWELAPNNSALAVRRLEVFEVVQSLREDAEAFGLAELAPPEFEDADNASIDNDILLAQTHQQRAFDFFLETSFHVVERLGD